METFKIIAKDEDKAARVRDEAQRLGFTCADSPDFIISYGGDGTLLLSERRYPGVPKIVTRDSRVCYKCHDTPVEEVLELVRDGAYGVEELDKLQLRDKLALNDVIIRNADPTQAIRFRITTEDQSTDLVIGDGVVVATPFGSTGYYYSITRSTFQEGIGVAFNNSTEQREPLLVHGSITVTLERGTAQLAVDNNPDVDTVSAGASVTVEKADDVARIVTT